MYKLLLISKYLRRRRIAWLSLLAVCLCTAMVLVVLSVMGGWLRMFRESFRGLSGAVLVHSPTLRGFAYYDEVIAGVQQIPGVRAAVPSIHSLGFINLLGQKTDGVQVIGLDLDRVHLINKLPQSLYRQYQEPQELLRKGGLPAAARAELEAQAARAATRPTFDFPLSPETYRSEFTDQNPKTRADPTRFSPMIAGSGVLNIHRDPKGNYVNRGDDNYHVWANLTVATLNERGRLDADSKTERNYWIVDTSHTGVWQVDGNSVYVPFDLLQKDLGMSATDDAPARCTEIDVDVAPGYDFAATRDAVSKVVDAVMAAHNVNPGYGYPRTMTWEESQATYLDQIENEVTLTTTLFGFISIVAIFMIFCIFYMIVQEKTRDIGIVKSVGATSAGVAAIFVGYGFLIGIVGGLMGLLVGWLIVHNINFLHEQVAHITGRRLWNPEVYIFDTVPNTIDPKATAIIVAVAIISSTIGAVLPAIKAARLNPVEALRFE